MSPHKLESIFTSYLEVEDILQTLKTGKAAGPESTDNRLLKELARPLSAPLTDLFNVSLFKGKVPNLWKQTNVNPYFVSLPGNYSEIIPMWTQTLKAS